MVAWNPEQPPEVGGKGVDGLRELVGCVADVSSEDEPVVAMVGQRTKRGEVLTMVDVDIRECP